MREDRGFKKYGTVFLALAVIALWSLPLIAAPQDTANTAADKTDSINARLTKQVRHELIMLPYYSVFDVLNFSIEGTDAVVLSGQVTRPTLKSAAENVVRRIEGVSKVTNNIEVLPLSPFDDRLRLAAYRTIFSQPGFDRYALQATSPIHIIVKNGNITLVGVVANTMDKNIAGIVANGVPGAFSVTNDLVVEHKG